jgi:hypothetical protein
MRQEDLNPFIRKTKAGKQYFEFDTLFELGNLIKRSVDEKYASINWVTQCHDQLSIKRSMYDLEQGTKTIAEAIELLKYGWEYGTTKLNEQVKLHSTSKSVKFGYSVAGAQVSVPRMLEGLPTDMIYTKMIEKPVKVLNVYKSAGYNGCYTADDIMKYSTKALQIVELLEAKGYRINLYIVKLNKKDNEEFFTKVKVKSANERLNIKKTAFCLANPAFQRRILWRLIELAPWIVNAKYWDQGYGGPVDSFSQSKMHSSYEEYMPESNKVFIPIIIDNVEQFVKDLHFEK